MSSLLAETVPLALGAAISPVLFLLQITTLTGPDRLRRGASVAAGAAVPLVIVGAIAVVIGDRTSFSGSDTTKAVIDLILGGLLIALGVWTLLRPPKPKPQDETKTAPTPPTPRRSFVLGTGAMASNVTTFALYIPAMKLIAAADVEALERVISTAIVITVTLTVAVVPLALTALAPERAGRILDRIGRWMKANSRRNTIVLAFGFGIYLLVHGLAAL